MAHLCCLQTKTFASNAAIVEDKSIVPLCIWQNKLSPSTTKFLDISIMPLWTSTCLHRTSYVELEKPKGVAARGYKSLPTILPTPTSTNATPSLDALSLANFCSVETISVNFTLAYVTMLFLSSIWPCAHIFAIINHGILLFQLYNQGIFCLKNSNLNKCKAHL